MLSALFPCGSVTGAPKIRAMQIIGELEAEPRGLYTGAFGLIQPNGDFSLNVPIRTLELTANGSGRMGIGSGIVADSEAASEWAECSLKAAFLTELDPGIKLIETLRHEAGQVLRLDRHLARLAASAAWLGFPCDQNTIRRQLAALPTAGPQRLRLTLDKQGTVEIQAFPLVPEPAGPRYARWADERIDSRHPLRRHKTTYRAPYDRAMQALAATPEVFDALFLNERGEVVEGSRSNVFVERDGVLLTPPLSSGALPGVLREELLESGRARERVLWPEDLAAGCLLGNSLRGLVAVRFGEAG
ncbi:MAG TPA: aminotransferase class IV [Rhodocyclaceae bacterium]|nr:aminotransferase class IV [Rhodocyclaceae bacterium]